MNNLLRLKPWVTVSESARHLSVILDEHVSEADLLRLALDGHITLSVNIVNGTNVRFGSLVPKEQAIWKKVPSLDGLRTVDIPKGVPLNDGSMIELAEEISSIGGVWDLMMIGCERLDVEHRYQLLTGGPEVTLVNIGGTFVQCGESICQLQAHFEDNEHFAKSKLKKPWSNRDNFYPAGGLPDDVVVVVRTAELGRFQAELSKADDVERKTGAPLPPRAEATYLNIIGALVELALGKSEAGRAHSIFTSQAAIIDALVAHNPSTPGISKTTLEGKFANARRLLQST